jgi:hypothetical protein
MPNCVCFYSFPASAAEFYSEPRAERHDRHFRAWHLLQLKFDYLD